ncbi:MAG: hypothetical protein RL385_316 [Pseudomonadota bacterium]|jgi:serine/threonine-protein kinase
MQLQPPPRFIAQPGAKLGRYELLQVLGSGGFAEVWLARLGGYAGFEKRVAIKVLQPARQGDDALRAMLIDEAHIAAKLAHPNVAAVHELGEEQGTLFVVMEYVSGGALDALVDTGFAVGEPPPLPVIARIVVDLCEGLHAAHELSVEGRPLCLVHRDVSPQNVLLSETGQCKLIDFGIAKARERRAKETTTGVTKGKISYMAPEHARGEPLDRRADLWSLAAVAFEMLEGRPVVDESHPLAQLRVLATEYTGPSFTRTHPAIATVLAQALARDRDARHPTVRAFAAALLEALTAAGLPMGSHADVVAYRSSLAVRAASIPRRAAQATSGVWGTEQAALEATRSEVALPAVQPPAAATRRSLIGTWLAAPVAAALGLVAFSLLRPQTVTPSPAAPQPPVLSTSAASPPEPALPAQEARAMADAAVARAQGPEAPSSAPDKPAAATTPPATPRASRPANLRARRPTPPRTSTSNPAPLRAAEPIDDRIE